MVNKIKAKSNKLSEKMSDKMNEKKEEMKVSSKHNIAGFKDFMKNLKNNVGDFIDKNDEEKQFE